MWEFIQQLTIVQWVLILGGGILAYPMLLKVARYIPIKTNPFPKPAPESHSVSLEAELVAIVRTWTVLRSACKKAGLTEAENQLLAVFPLLVKEQSRSPNPLHLEKGGTHT